MKKQTNSVLLKVFPFLRKNQEKKSPRDYTTLVESFKTRVQIE
ncbi:hypothetical protein [Polaribacter pectinis]|nr:hypothetical protein [Polaribacter pectinis]